MPLNAKLVVVGGEVKTAEIKLRLPSTIGRGRGCTIMLPQALVSRQHCEIFEANGKLMVRDLGSLNGTFVNNQKLAEPSPINSEELLSIGTVTFRVVYDASGASSPPPGPGPVMKPSAKETSPAAATLPASENSEPLEIGEFDFDETEEVDSPDASAGEKTPSGPIEVPTIRVQESTPKPAAPAPMAARAIPAPAVAVPISTLPSPPPPASVVPAPAPVAKVIIPATAPPPPAPSKPAPPAATAPPEAEEKAEEEDDFQDFLKSLGK
jgi:predicted component of type VI protein secretion system